MNVFKKNELEIIENLKNRFDLLGKRKDTVRPMSFEELIEGKTNVFGRKKTNVLIRFADFYGDQIRDLLNDLDLNEMRSLDSNLTSSEIERLIRNPQGQYRFPIRNQEELEIVFYGLIALRNELENQIQLLELKREKESKPDKKSEIYREIVPMRNLLQRFEYWISYLSEK